ncbi:MAG: RDD family protein [Methylophilaceae bacterium]
MIEHAGLTRRFLACLYELLSLVAIWLFCTFVFVMVHGQVETIMERLALQVLLWVITGVYLIACWVKTGQTLASQAWKIQILNDDNALLRPRKALIRYILATVSLILLGLGFLWAIIDKEHLFLHDRLIKTKIIKVPAQ